MVMTLLDQTFTFFLSLFFSVSPLTIVWLSLSITISKIHFPTQRMAKIFRVSRLIPQNMELGGKMISKLPY